LTTAFHLNHVGYKGGYMRMRAHKESLSSEPCGI